MTDEQLYKYWTKYDERTCIKIDYKDSHWKGINHHLFDVCYGKTVFLDAISWCYRNSKNDFEMFKIRLNGIMAFYEAKTSQS